MRLGQRVLPILFSTVISAATTAEATHVIDNFEAGPFSLAVSAGGTPQTGSQFIGSNGISPTRETRLEAGFYYPVNADLVISPTDDGVVVSGFKPRFQVDYDLPAPTDITYGGFYDHFYVTMNGPSGGMLSVAVSVIDENGLVAVKSIATSTQGTAVIAFSDLGVEPANLLAVELIQFSFNGNLDEWPGSATISDIRLAHGPVSLVNYNVLYTLINWCPTCPPESLRFDAFTAAPPSPFHEMIVTVEDVIDTDPCIRITGFDSGDAAGGPGPFAGSALYWDAASEFGAAAFDFLVELVPQGGVGLAFVADPVIVLDDGGAFELAYTLRYESAASGEPLGESVETVRYDVVAGQPLEFRDVSVTPASMLGPGGSAYRISFTLAATGDVDEAEALVTSMQVGDWDPAPVTSVGGAPDGARRPGLSAEPSVTREGTVLRLARPQEARGALSILDVTGRAVRRLDVEAGVSAVRWDGLDDAGRHLASGVYWASLPSAGDRLVARIMRVR